MSTDNNEQSSMQTKEPRNGVATDDKSKSFSELQTSGGGDDVIVTEPASVTTSPVVAARGGSPTDDRAKEFDHPKA